LSFMDDMSFKMFLTLCSQVYFSKSMFLSLMIFSTSCFYCGAYLSFNHYELYKVPYFNFTSSQIHKSMFQKIMFMFKFLFLSSFKLMSIFLTMFLFMSADVSKAYFYWCWLLNVFSRKGETWLIFEQEHPILNFLWIPSFLTKK
jgi:hypothetical protein